MSGGSQASVLIVMVPSLENGSVLVRKSIQCKLKREKICLESNVDPSTWVIKEQLAIPRILNVF